MDATGRKRERARKNTQCNKQFLPDDIIPNILSRLPAKYASQYRLVCKGWRDLTLDPDFVDLQFRLHSNFPMILVANPRIYSKTIDYFLLDKWWEFYVQTAERKLLNRKLHVDSADSAYPCRALFSHAGLAVFENYDTEEKGFIVGHPLDPENVIITLSKAIRGSEICGVYFHPSRKEYCSLWMIRKSDKLSGHKKWIKYKMLTLGPNPSMKTISNPFGYRVKRPLPYPLFINNYLYWMLQPESNVYEYSGFNDIMQFDILSEEFTVITCPVPLDGKEFSYNNIDPLDDKKFSSSNTSLLNIDGTLSFILILPKKITIWRLEDRAQQLWTTANYTLNVNLYQGIGIEVPEPIAVVKGKLALLSKRRPIVYNLMQGTMYCCETPYTGPVWFLSHQMSLASLTNCTSKISIDQKGVVAGKVSEG